MAQFLIVDGHSIIFAWPDLHKLHAKRMVLAREALVQRLTTYHDFSGVRVVVVFDGQGRRVQEETVPGGVQIFYSASGQTADAVIERLVAVYAPVHEITVATGDFMEQQTTISFGGRAVSPEILLAMVEESERELQNTIRKHRRGR